MEIIFNAGDKVNVKGYRSEGVVTVTFTTESRDFGSDIVRVQMGSVEIKVMSEDVTIVVEVAKHESRVVSSRPMTATERLNTGKSSRAVVGELRTSYGKTISLR